MDHAKLLDVLMSLPVSDAILPCAVCFASSRLANHAICSFIDSSGYVSGPIRICLFIDYKIIIIITLVNVIMPITEGLALRSSLTSLYFIFFLRLGLVLTRARV